MLSKDWKMILEHFEDIWLDFFHESNARNRNKELPKGIIDSGPNLPFASFWNKEKVFYCALTLLGPTYFLYTKAGGGVKFHPPLKSQLSLKKSMFFCHEVNFCINSALF